MVLKRVRAQSLAEYALLVTAVIAVAASMFPLVKRGIQRVVKVSADQIANQEGAEQNYFADSGFTVGVNSAAKSDHLRTRRDWPGVIQTQDFDTTRAHDESLTNLGFVRELNGKTALPPTKWCGDHICQLGDEDCLSCWVDCGACPVANNGICEIGENCHDHPECACTTDGGCQQDAGGNYFCCTKNLNQCGEDGCNTTHPSCVGANRACIAGNCSCQSFACNGECCASGQVCRIGGDGKCCSPTCNVGSCGASDGCGGFCNEDTCLGDDVCHLGACCTPDGSCNGVLCGGATDNCGQVCTDCYPTDVCNGTTCCTPKCQANGFCLGHDDSCGGTCSNTDCLIGESCKADGTCCLYDANSCKGCVPKNDNCGDPCSLSACLPGTSCNTALDKCM